MTPTPALATPRFETDSCANCFEPLPRSDKHRPWLFCSEVCKETANTVRYWPAASRDGRFEAGPSVRVAISTRLAHMLAGGYLAAGRRIPPDVRLLVIERDRACVLCGNPGEEIAHIDGDSSDPGNLQLLCRPCHHEKTASHMVPATTEQSARIFVILIRRVIPDGPALLCDDEFGWQSLERRLRSERLARLRAVDPGELSAAEITAARTHTGEVVDFDDDEAERSDEYYAGYGGNSHYTGASDREY